MRLIYIIVLFIITFPLFSQSNTVNEIDSILEESYDNFVELQYIESFKLANKSLQLSTETKYEKGIIYSYLYIARVLQEIGQKKEAIIYIQKIQDENYLKNDPFVEAEIYRLKGRIASSEHLYSLEKNYYLRQLEVSEDITDPQKRNMSKTMAYFFIQHLYAKQSKLDSVEVYQDLLKKHLDSTNDSNISYYYISTYIDKGLVYTNLGRYDEAAQQLDKSLELIENRKTPLLFYSLQVYGDLEMARGDTSKAISYYKRALKHSIDLNINHKTMYLHKKISDCLIENVLEIDAAKHHLSEYYNINDSLERHNKQVADIILSEIVRKSDEDFSKKNKLFIYIVTGLILLAVLLGVFLILKNRIHKRKLMRKSNQLISTTEKIESLEEELESNIFQDIIELAKSNSPEFLPLFEKGYPEFVAAIRKLNPSIRSSELYFCALAYLNFSTKDIASFTFVTTRAVQVRRNRLRKKYDIPSEVDFNEWFRNLENENILRS